jgi:hypothetical protein
MIWLIATTTMLAIIFAAYVHAKAFQKTANEDKPSFQPTIFLEAKPSQGFWNPSDSIVNAPLSLSRKKFVATGSIELVTRLQLMFPEPPGYGLYSYLLFGSRSEATRSKRYAAARGYCQNFDPIEEVLKEHRAENLNAFAIPTRPSTPADTYCKSEKMLVDEYYDYSLADQILRKINLEGDVIYLVACDKPILADGCDRTKMLVFNLTPVLVTENLSELCIIYFRDQTRKPKYWAVGIFNFEKFLVEFRTKILPQMARFIRIIVS